MNKTKSNNKNKQLSKTKNRKGQSALGAYSGGVRRETVFKMPISNHTIFPDRYFCSLRTTMTTIVDIGSASTIARQFHAYKINGIATSTGPAGVGPSINGGAFDANYPSGLYQLLGSTSNTGGNGIYGRYRVHSSKIEVTWVPAVNAASANNLGASQVTIFPTSDVYAAFSAMSQTQVSEQPWAKTAYYTPQMMTEPRKHKHSIDVLQLVGDRFKSSIEQPAFSGTTAADPTELVYWVVLVGNAFPNANAYLAQGQLNVTVVHFVELFDRNLQASLGPSLSQASSSVPAKSQSWF